MPSLRSSTHGCYARLAKQRHPDGQPGRLLQVGTGHGVTITCTVVPHPGSFNPSDGGSELTANQSRELRWGKYRICAINPDYGDEDEEEEQDGEEDMEEEDSETTNLEYSTVSDRTGGRRGTKHERQEKRDAEPASVAIRDGEPSAGQGRVTAKSQMRMTVAADTGDRVQDRDWGSNTGERRQPANPPGRVSGFRNHRLIS